LTTRYVAGSAADHNGKNELGEASDRAKAEVLREECVGVSSQRKSLIGAESAFSFAEEARSLKI